MAYRKFTAENIFTGYEILGNDHVLITDEKGKVQDIVKKTDAGEEVEEFNGTLTPGFINCHCHLELSHMRGLIPEGMGMVNFLLTVMGSRNHPAGEIASAIADAEKNMISSGIVAVGDICNTADTVLQKQQQNIYYHNFIEAMGFSEASADSRFEQALEMYHQFHGKVSIVPHAPYSVSEKLLKLIDQHDLTSLLSIHNQESHAENELFESASGDFLDLYKAIGAGISGLKRTGRSSIQSYLNKISQSHSILLVHNTVTDQSDIDWIDTDSAGFPELYWCICPNANLYINGMLADVPMLNNSGRKIVIGTDSLASNNQLDIISELSTLQLHFPGLTIAQLLGWATVNGAEAMGVLHTYGSFEKDKTPGIVLLENIIESSLHSAVSRRIL
jgi:cytosine/adenosine deaminase-related metal-dependent hydrolase